MGLIETLGRIPKILEANINALLDKAEDPEKMIDQLLVDYKRQLADVKGDTAEVLADLKLAQNRLAKCDEEIAEMTSAAQNALKKGDEASARKILAAKQNKEETRQSLQDNVDVCQKNADLMKEGYNKLVENISSLEERKTAAKAKISIAKATEKLNDTKSFDSANKAFESFAKYEEEAERRLAKAQASSELDSKVASVDDLVAQYSGGEDSVSVDDELAAMKAQLGL